MKKRKPIRNPRSYIHASPIGVLFSPGRCRSDAAGHWPVPRSCAAQTTSGAAGVRPALSLPDSIVPSSTRSVSTGHGKPSRWSDRMIFCGQCGGRLTVTPTAHLCRLPRNSWRCYLAAPMSTSSPAPRSSRRTLPSRRSFSRLIPDNSNEIVVAYNDSRNAASKTRSTSPPRRSPRMAALPSPASPRPMVKAPLRIPSATPWFFITAPAVPGSPSGSTLAAVVRASADISLPLPRIPIAGRTFCVHTNSADDRESGFADNSASSPFNGRMYVSWNDFNVGGGALRVRFSPDNGLTWSTEQDAKPQFHPRRADHR